MCEILAKYIVIPRVVTKKSIDKMQNKSIQLIQKRDRQGA